MRRIPFSIVAFLFLGISGLAAQYGRLSHPDHYPADSVIVVLREDTSTLELRAWIINRSQEIIVIDALDGHPREWLEVKDGYGNWQVYNSLPSLYCGMASAYVRRLRKDEFYRVEFLGAPGSFLTKSRARFTIADSNYYSAPIEVLIDTFAIGNPVRHVISKYYALAGADSLHLSRVSYSEGLVRMSRKDYPAARRHLTEAVRYDPQNYPGHFELALAVFLHEKEDKETQESVMADLLKKMFRYWELNIPEQETDLWAKIEVQRKVYTAGLK